MVGGVLVAAGALGTFVAAGGADGGPRTTYAVAARDLPAGARIAEGDVHAAAASLPLAQSRGAFDEVAAVIGQVTRVALTAGEFVQRSAVQPAGAAGPLVSFAVDRAAAVNGALRAGDRIDIVATYGGGEDARSVVVAADVLVTDIGAAGPSSERVVLTLAVDDAATLLAVTAAVHGGAVTVARAGAS
jgi:pilus assembly protein CpaB